MGLQFGKSIKNASGLKNGLNNVSSGDDKKWYQKTGWIIFWLICFFPVGLFLMWKYSNWNRIVKIGVSVLFVIAIVISPSSDLEKITLNADVSQNYDINEEIVIGCSTTPSNYELTESDFKLSGGTLKILGKKIVFSASEAGTYNIYAENSQVKSNELIITVEDKETIAQAKAEEEAKKRAEEKEKKKAEEERKKAEEEKKKAEEERKKAEEEAQHQAELEAQRQAELEAQRQATAQQSTTVAPQQGTQSSSSSVAPQGTMVWIPASGKGKYHRNSGCSNMKNPTQISKSTAEARGLEPCKKCY